METKNNKKFEIVESKSSNRKYVAIETPVAKAFFSNVQFPDNYDGKQLYKLSLMFDDTSFIEGELREAFELAKKITPEAETKFEVEKMQPTASRSNNGKDDKSVFIKTKSSSRPPVKDTEGKVVKEELKNGTKVKARLLLAINTTDSTAREVIYLSRVTVM